MRKSVHAIRDLDPKHQSQGAYSIPTFTQPPILRNFAVIEAYARSLRVTFISAIAVFAIVNILVIPMKLPNLKRRQENEENRSSAIAADADDEE